MDESLPAFDDAERSFLLQRVQPAMTGLIDGSLSTLAPIFPVVIATHDPHTAFIAGLATALGAGVSMAFSEGLSDTGEMTGRGNPLLRGAITGVGTFLLTDFKVNLPSLFDLDRDVVAWRSIEDCLAAIDRYRNLGLYGPDPITRPEGVAACRRRCVPAAPWTATPGASCSVNTIARTPLTWALA